MGKLDARDIRRFMGLLFAIWTVGITLFLFAEIRHHSTTAEELARNEVRAHYDWMVILRTWVSKHGGVYVPLDELTPSNKYLEVPEKDIRTPSGRKLTMMNPAYVTRQIYEQYYSKKGMRGRLTSLKPINPGNAPDPWEKEGLEAFERGSKEKFEFAGLDGKHYLRLMRPLVVEKACLKCHEKQGYREGDVRGGLSLSLPVDAFFEQEQKGIRTSVLSYSAIWLIGTFALYFFSAQMLKSLRVREENEQTLRESEKGLAEAQRLARLGSWEWDIATGGLKWSDEIYRIFGVEPRQFEATYEAFIGTVHPGDRAYVRQRVDEAVAGKTDYDINHRIILPDGGEKVVREVGEVFRDGAGTAVRMVGTVQDITEQVEGEERLRLFRALTDQASDLIITVDFKTERLLDVNEAACSALGYSRDELLKRAVQDIHIADDPVDAEWFRKVPRSQETALLGGWFRRKNGTKFPVEVNARYVRAGGREYMVAVARDVTERREAEAARERIERENSRLATAVKRAGEGVVITDAEGKIEFMNPAYEELSGYTFGEVRGLTPRVFKSGRQDRHFYEELWRAITAGRVWRGRIVNRRKDGTLFEEEMTISPILDAGGKIVNFVSVKHDITREAALQKSRSYFTAITAHELRTPLAKLHMVDSLIKRLDAAKAEQEHLEQVRSSLAESIESFDRIVNAAALISDMTRTGAEKPFIKDFLYYDIVAVLENVRGSLAREERRVSLEADMGNLPRHIVVMGNRGMIQQALEEVLSNAIKFTPDGKKVTLHGSVKNDAVHIEVEDEGAGIPDEKLEEVFIPYFSLENPLEHSTGRYKFHGGGMGLGLTVAKLIMEYHGGALTIGKGQNGSGTLVALSFPVAEDELSPGDV